VSTRIPQKGTSHCAKKIKHQQKGLVEDRTWLGDPTKMKITHTYII
jgi:hypothetical protein